MDLGTGVSILFASGFFAEIVNASIRGWGRKSIASGYAGLTGGETFMPSDRYDAGTLEVELHFNTRHAPPISSAADTITIQFPGAPTTISTFAGKGFMTDFSITVPDEDRMAATATLKLTGIWTFNVPV